MVLKCAFLGAWHSHAIMHVREAAQHPEAFQIIGMYDEEPEVVRRNQDRWRAYIPDMPVFPSIDAVLESDAEAVIVEGRIHKNLLYAERALKAGKHVLLEKPAGVSLSKLERVHALAQKNGLYLQMAYMWRYNPAIREIIRLVRAGALGDIFYFRGHIPKPKVWHPQIAETLGEYQAALYFEMAGHIVDVMVTLMGEPLMIRPVLAQHYGDRKHVDSAVVVHEFKRALATVDTAAMHVGADRARRIEVYGTEGAAIHTPVGSEHLSLCLETAREGYAAGWQDIKLEQPPDGPTLLRELAACIHGEKTPDYTSAHDMAVQRTLFTGCGIPDGKAMKPAGPAGSPADAALPPSPKSDDGMAAMIDRLRQIGKNR